MTTDIRLEELDVIVEGQSLAVHGPYLRLEAAQMRKGAGPRTALMHGAGDRLLINPTGDYPGGVALHGRLSVDGDIGLPIGAMSSSGGTSTDRFTPIKIKREELFVGQELLRMQEQIGLLRAQVAELQMRASILPQAQHYDQHGWRWCGKCSNLTFAPNQSISVCAQDQKPHDLAKSSDYTMFPHASRYGGQPGWKWCRKCQGMCHGSQPDSGHCPAGAAHDRSTSPNYLLWTDAPAVGAAPRDFGAQDNWRWCNRCYGLFHGGTPGACPAPGGEAHNAGGSYNYFVQF